MQYFIISAITVIILMVGMYACANYCEKRDEEKNK